MLNCSFNKNPKYTIDTINFNIVDATKPKREPKAAFNAFFESVY